MNQKDLYSVKQNIMKIYNITIKREIIDLTDENSDEEGKKKEIQQMPQIR